MNKENIPIITDREELYDKCENMEQLFDKYYLPLLDKYYNKIYELQIENQKLKEQLEASEKARKEAIELLEKHLEAKSYGNHKYELFSREYLEELLKILNIDKGE